MEISLCHIGLSECFDMCSIWDDILPSHEVFLDYMIQSNLLMDIESVLVKSIPNLFIESNIFYDWSSNVGNVESLDSSIEWQVSDPDEFDSSLRIFDSCDVQSVSANPISYVDFRFPL